MKEKGHDYVINLKSNIQKGDLSLHVLQQDL